MTEPEVEGLLGGPAGDYSTPPRRFGFFGSPCPRAWCGSRFKMLKPPGMDGAVKRWEGDGWYVDVLFDGSGRVHSAGAGQVFGGESRFRRLVRGLSEALGHDPGP